MGPSAIQFDKISFEVKMFSLKKMYLRLLFAKSWSSYSLWTSPGTQNSIKLYSALVHDIFCQSQWNFSHITTVLLSWLVLNVVVIGWAHFKPGHCKFWLNFKFNWNTITRMSAWAVYCTEIETKWPPFCRHFQIYFWVWILFYFDLLNFNEVCSPVSN